MGQCQPDRDAPTGQHDVRVPLAGTGVTAVLMTERAVLLAEPGVLLVADTHFGKTETLRRKGVPVPPGPRQEAMHRLRSAAARSGALRIVVLGDLLHAPTGITARLERDLRTLRDELPAGVTLELVPGNHDQKLRGTRLAELCDRVDIRLLDAAVRIEPLERPLLLVHDPDESADPGGFRIGGHLHPAVVLRGGGDAVKLPAAVVGPDRLVLPAFSSFVAGVSTRPSAGERVFAFGPGGPFEVCGRPHRTERPSVTA